MKTILYNINVEKLNNKIFDIIIYNELNNLLFNIANFFIFSKN